MGGGNTGYLSYWLQQSGFADKLPDLLRDTVYVGVSAGSAMVTRGVNADYFPQATMEFMERVAAKLDVPLYAFDDETALEVVDGEVEVVSKGQWRLFDATTRR